MKHVNLKIRAFTLLESILVLFVISFLIILFSSSVTKTLGIVKGELFVLEFENYYKNTQEEAILLKKEQSISVKEGYLMTERAKIKLPDEVVFEDFEISFGEKGENSSLKKIRLNLPLENKVITYQLELGNGKYKKTVN